MELSSKQMQLVNSTFGLNTVIDGYSGVGKTTVLIKKYEQLCEQKDISRNDTIFIVSDYLKKQLILNQYHELSSKYNILNIYTMNELIHKYLKHINLPLFENTIDVEQKHGIIEGIIDNYYHREIDFSYDFIIEEIKYIQSNICINDREPFEETLVKELKMYLLTPRRSIKKGLLSFREKQDIWNIYNTYLKKALTEDFFDEETFYQSFLRLLYHHYEQEELAMSFSNLLIDDIQDFSRVQLDILYHLYDQSKIKYSLMVTLDELKSKDRHKNFKNSLLFKCLNNSATLEIDYKHSKNVFNIIKSSLTNNELFKKTLNYKTNNNKNDFKSVLTFFYNKSVNEKREVFFDRLDLLIHNMNYRLSDILIVFYDKNNLMEMHKECLSNNIKVFDIYEHVQNKNADGLTFIHKDELVSCEFKVVVIFDADNKKMCIGPVNKIINVTNNFQDSIYFYTTLGIARDFLIINASISEPSHLLLPSHIDYDQFVFEVNSKFQFKSTLNVYRITDFISWIKENLVKYYDYHTEDFSSQSGFDLLINVNYHKIGFIILDNNIDNDIIGKILKIGKDLTHIVIFDNHHYLTFKNVNNEFVRITDLPNK